MTQFFRYSAIQKGVSEKFINVSIKTQSVPPPPVSCQSLRVTTQPAKHAKREEKVCKS